MSRVPARRDEPQRPALAPTLVVGGLAVFGALALVQWLLGAVFGIIRFGIVVVVLVAVLTLLLGRRADR